MRSFTACDQQSVKLLYYTIKAIQIRKLTMDFPLAVEWKTSRRKNETHPIRDDSGVQYGFSSTYTENCISVRRRLCGTFHIKTSPGCVRHTPVILTGVEKPQREHETGWNVDIGEEC